MQFVDHQHAHADLAQQCQRQLLHFRQPWARAQWRAHRGEQRDVEADHRRFGRHLHDQHRDVFLVGVGAGRMRAPEFLDDHRLAVVGRANQQQVGHALLVWPRIQGFQPVQRLDRARIADPAVGAKALDALVRRQPGQPLVPPAAGGQVDDGIFVHGYHSSIWSNGLAGGWLSACGSAMSVSGGNGLVRPSCRCLEVLASIRVTPRLARGLLRGGHDLAHLADHAEQRRLIHLFAPLLPQFRQRLPLFPEGDSRMRQGTVGNFQVMLPSGSRTQMRLMSRGSRRIRKGGVHAERNPRLERIGVVVDVVDDKAGAGQRAAEDGQKIDQKEGAVTTAGTPTRATASAQRAAGGWSRPLCTEPCRCRPPM